MVVAPLRVTHLHKHLEDRQQGYDIRRSAASKNLLPAVVRSTDGNHSRPKTATTPPPSPPPSPHEPTEERRQADKAKDHMLPDLNLAANTNPRSTE